MKKLLNRKKDKIQKGISLISLIITVIVIIIIAAMALRGNYGTVDESFIADFKNELKSIEVNVSSVRLSNQQYGIGEEYKEAGFYPVIIENPPPDFVNFTEGESLGYQNGEVYGYVVDLEHIKEDENKRGNDYQKYKEYAANKTITFGENGRDNDVYIYDATGKVYYVKGIETNDGIYHSSEVIKTGINIGINKIYNEESNSVDIIISVDKDDVAIKINNVTINPEADNTYKHIALNNGTYVVTIESEDGVTTRVVNVTEIKEQDYIITYHFNDGVSPDQTQIKKGSNQIRINPPTRVTRDGYTLAGWSKNPLAEEVDYKSGSIFTENADTDLYAVWKEGEAREFTITFNANNGMNAPAPITKTEREPVFLPSEVPTRAGYSFVGWSLDKNSDTKDYSAGAQYEKDGNAVLYAVWEAGAPIIVQVNLKASPGDGGKVAGGGAKEVGNIVYVTATPNDGYVFDRWIVDNSSANVILDNSFSERTSFVMPNGTVELTASFKTYDYDYVIKYNANNGSGAPNSQYKKNGENITISNEEPTRTGYDFKGWSDTVSDLDTVKYQPGQAYSEDKSVTLYAVWNKDETGCIVKFDPNGGVVNESSRRVEQNKTYGEKEELPIPNRVGYKFVGWYKDKTWAEQITETTKVTTVNNHTIYAKWIKTYQIKYILNDGQVSANPTSYTEETETFTLVNPTRVGYTFTGWSGSNGNIPQLEVSIEKGSNGDKEYVANFIARTDTKYLVEHYKQNVEDDNYTLYETDEEKGTSDTFVTPEVKAYTGFTAPNVETNRIDANGKRVIKYYYTRNKYTVSLIKGNGIANVTGSGTYKYEAEVTINAEVKPGYTWSKWTGTHNTTTQNYSFKMPPNNVSDTSNTTINTYTISYTLNKGTATNPTTYTVETETFTLNNPSRVGYIFTGWTGSNGTNPQMTVTIPKGTINNKSYTANYTPRTDTKYVVEHYQQNITDDNYTKFETENLKGTSDASITPAVKTYAGFTSPATQTTTVAPDGSRVIKYYYTRNKYTVTLTKGTGISSVSGAGSYKHGASVTIKASVLDGYTWSKWSGTHSTTTQNYTFTMPIGNVSDTANTTLNVYTISYTLNKGTIPTGNPTTYTVESGEIILNNPVRIGYDFIGWSGSNGTTAQITVKIPAGSIGNKSYTANYTPRTDTKYVVEHYQQNITDDNYTKYETQNLTGTSDASITPAVKTYSGFTSPAKQTTTVAPDGSRVIKYYYTRNKYTVTLTKGNGISSVTGAGSYKHGASVTINASVLAGYTWSKWSGTHNTITQNYTFTMPIGNVSDTANTTINTYTISYTLNSGTVATANPTTYTVETATFTLNNPTRTGYTFKGWTGSNGTTAQTSVSIAKGSTGNKSYTANWTANTNTKYVVEHYQQNIADDNYTKYETQNLTGTSDASITPAVKTYTGFTSPATQTTTVSPDGSRVIKYYYTRNKYTVTLTKGTGVASVSGAGTYKYGASVTINASMSAGYSWSKWSGTHSTTTQNYTFTMPAGNVSDTANTTPNTYYVTYDANGGSGAPAQQAFVFNSGARISTTVPTRTNYRFSHWVYSGVSFAPGDAIPSDWGSFTLTAQWIQTTCLTCGHSVHSGACQVQVTVAYTCTAGSRTWVNCSTCGADGKVNTSCGTCGGDGKVSSTCTSWSTCSTCGGDALINYTCTAQKSCTTCGGDGKVNYTCTSWSNCSTCGGDAKIDYTCTSWSTCSTCGGDAKIDYTCTDWSNCGTCGGDGYVNYTCTSWSTCSACGGDSIKDVSCFNCGGDGKVSSACGTCGGDGKMTCNGSYISSGRHGGTCGSCGGTLGESFTCSTCGGYNARCEDCLASVSTGHYEISCTNSSCNNGRIPESVSCSYCSGTGKRQETCTSCSSGKIACSHGYTSSHTVTNGTSCSSCGGDGAYSCSHGYNYSHTVTNGTSCSSCSSGRIACSHGYTTNHTVTNGASCTNSKCSSGKISCTHGYTSNHTVTNGTTCTNSSCKSGTIPCSHGNTSSHVVTNGATCTNSSCKSGTIPCTHGNTSSHVVTNGTACTNSSCSNGRISCTHGYTQNHSVANSASCTNCGADGTLENSTTCGTCSGNKGWYTYSYCEHGQWDDHAATREQACGCTSN